MLGLRILRQKREHLARLWSHSTADRLGEEAASRRLQRGVAQFNASTRICEVRYHHCVWPFDRIAGETVAVESDARKSWAISNRRKGAHVAHIGASPHCGHFRNSVEEGFVNRELGAPEEFRRYGPTPNSTSVAAGPPMSYSGKRA